MAALMASCSNAPQFHIEGTIEGAADSMLYLEANTLEGIQSIDSARIKSDGTFAFAASKTEENPEFYALRIGKERIQFAVDSTETIRVQASYPALLGKINIEGSEQSAKMQEISRLQQQLQRQIIAIERNEDLLPGDATDSIAALINACKERLKNDYIYQDPRAAYAYYAVCLSFSDLAGNYQLFNPFRDRKDVRCYAAVATAWDGLWPDAPRTQQICNMAIKGLENTAPVQQRALEIDESKVSETGIIDIELPDINSRMHKLSSLKGKVVMLDFTMYGAKESAQRTRLMRDLYNKYHAQGLEIYQISLDDDTHFWKFSVENLPWICVHETDGQATNSYAVGTLPTFFLINRQNEIVRRSDFVKNLEEEIKQLL